MARRKRNSNSSIAISKHERGMKQGPVFRSKPKRKPRLIRDGVKDVRRLVGEVEPGERVCGITGGQFNLVDILFHLLNQTGPADVVVSAWTIGNAEADRVAAAKKSGRIREVLWLIDRSFPSRQPGYADKMSRLYGAESMRVTRTHAKFLLIDGGVEGSRFLVQTSMNMNQNKRMESFDITEGSAIVDHYRALVDRLWKIAVPGLTDSKGSRDVLAAALAPGGEGALVNPWTIHEMRDNEFTVEGIGDDLDLGLDIELDFDLDL